MSITVAASPAPTSLGTGAVTDQKVDQAAVIASMSHVLTDSRAVARSVMGNVPASPPENRLGKINLYV